MATLASVLLLIRGIGPASLIQILTNSRRKNRLDAAYLDHQISPPFSPGLMSGYAQYGHEVLLYFTNAHLRLSFPSPDILRLSWLPVDLPSSPSPHNAFQHRPAQPVSFSSAEDDTGLHFSTSALHAAIAPDGAAQIFTANGCLLRSEQPPSFQTVSANSLHPPLIRSTSRAFLQPGEFLAGLGEHCGPLGLRGRSFSLWNTDPGGAHHPASDPIYMPLPVYHSLLTDASSLIFFDNSARAVFDFDTPTAPDLAQAVFESGELTWYLFTGPPAHAVESFCQLTGLPALPPRWSLGYHQSRWGYKTAADIRQVAAGFAEHDLPLDVIHLDIDYMDGFRVFTVDAERFSDLPALAAELHIQGIRLVTIIDPGVKQDPSYPVYQQGLAASYFTRLPDGKLLTAMVWPGKCAFPDFTDPQVRDWWGELYRFLLDSGVDGIWHDMNEPAAFSTAGSDTLPLAAVHNLDGCPGDHLQAHNRYGLEMNRAAFAALRRLRPERRPWILSRSGWVGNAGYAWNWTADVATSWENLGQTIATILNMGLSGIPFTGSDIGGFTADPSPELFLRWFQLAAFNALMRTHSAVGTAPRHPWSYGEPYTSHLRAVLYLRRRLLPYLYTQAWLSAQTGAPLIRPLFWIEPKNPALWPVADAFLCGDALLVAPVAAAGATARQITLPGGSWFDYWSDEILVGPGTLSRPAPLAQIPLLVRNLSLLPLQDGDVLTLHFYLDTLTSVSGQTHLGTLYSDAGDGSGPQRLDVFHLSRRGRSLDLTWTAEGDFPFPYSEVRFIFHGCQPAIPPTPMFTGSPAASYPAAGSHILCTFEG